MTNRSRPLPYVNAYADRHGKMRHYFRRKGFPRRALPGQLGSREWREAYDAALASTAPTAPRSAKIERRRIPNGDHVTWSIKKAFHTAQSRAPRRGVPFELTVTDVRDMFGLQLGKCAVTGLPFKCEPQSRFHKAPFAPSLDRKDCRKGYTLDNVRLVCVAVNFAMGEWGEAVFEQIARGYWTKRA